MCLLYCIKIPCEGNDALSDLTSQTQYELRIDMRDSTNAYKYATYSNFFVASEDEQYKLSISGYAGTSGMRKQLAFSPV
jgi:ficolin